MTTPLRCVLIDDDRDFLALESRYVAKAVPGLDILTFHSSVDALEFLFRHEVGLVITDYRMPFLDGIELTRALRAADRCVPIWIASNDDAEQVSRRGAFAGASGFLPKASFRDAVRPVLEQVFRTGAVPQPA